MFASSFFNRWLLAAICVVFGFLSGPLLADDPIEFDVSIEPDQEKSDCFEVRVRMKIKKGWHTYAQVPDSNPSPITEVQFELPKGLERDGETKLPLSLPYNDLETKIFQGAVTFRQAMKMTAELDDRKIGVKISYQVCNEKLCLPPDEHVSTVVVPASVQMAKPATFTFDNAHFDAPEMLMVGDDPLNKAARQMYPSPAMFDIDNDGQLELIVGDIFGSVNIYENQNDDHGDPVWQTHRSLKSVEGKKIKVSNW